MTRLKHLIIGIDGGDESICKQMPMPFVQTALQQDHRETLTIDLLSRGWAEMISGKYARDTKGFYMVAQCDGTNKIIFKYSLAELLSNSEVTPIWELPGDTSIGMMNVPTTFPAPTVKGFFVSGAGGGVNKVDGIPPELCHPESLAQDLEASRYKIDIRFGTAGIKEIDPLFDQLVDMLENRRDAFLKLCHEHTPEFAFLCYRAPTVVQYLAMSEMEAYFARLKGNSSSIKPHEEVWQRNFERLYATLDNCIKDVLTSLQPENWIITSDHGAVPYRYRVSINRYLQDAGFQKYQFSPLRTVRKLAGTILKGRAFSTGRIPRLKESEAFGHWYLSGIFVNDKSRFGGPVDPMDVEQITDKICQHFNATPEAKKFEMEAKPYRRNYQDSKYQEHLPDIKVHCPDEIFFSSFDGPFIRPNPEYKALPAIDKIKGGMHTGQKGRHPIFICNDAVANKITTQDPRDLTLVYKLTERIFEK